MASPAEIFIGKGLVRRRAGRIIHGTICALTAAVFVWIAARRFDFSGPFGPILPFHSTNNYLVYLIQSSHGSEDILAVLDALPKTEPVAVVYRGDDEKDTFLAFLVSYFAWPRKIESFSVKRANAASQLQRLAQTRVSAAFYCGVAAPAGTAPLVRIGEGLVVAPRTGNN
jgi:hypothetical protein